MWYNKYVGIRYSELGRDSSGVDCWGLARLVYKEEFGVELPDFSDLYTTTSDQALTSQLIEFNRDGWELVSEPTPGDLICFRILGYISHIGIYIGDAKFIHAREGIDSVVIESLTSTQWQHRVAGTYRYTNSIVNTISAAPHPLRYERISEPVVTGTTVLEAINQINTRYSVPSDVEASYVVVLNGKPLAYDTWATTRISQTDTLEYRALARGGSARQLLMLAVVIAAVVYAPVVAAELFGETAVAGGIGAAGEVATVTTVSKAAVIGTQVGLTMAGMALVNAIAPIRPPSINDGGIDESKRASLLGGGSNQANLYGAIPVVLGKARITPYLGAQQWVDFVDSERNYLNSLVVWGFGPLKISDICIGAQQLTQYTGYTAATLEGYPGESTWWIDSIYGKDTYQVVPNTQLVNIDPDNNPNNIPSESRNPWTQVELIDQDSNNIKIAIHFPEGLRQLIVKGEGAGDVNAAPFTAEIQYRKVGTAWPADSTNRTTYQENIFQVPSTFYSYIDYTTYNTLTGAYSYISNTLYQWVKIGVTDEGAPIIVYGHPSETQNGEPSQALKTAIKAQGYTNLVSGVVESTRIPSTPSNMRLLYTICIYGNTIIQTIDNRAGLGLVNTGFEFNYTPISDPFYDWETGTITSTTSAIRLIIGQGTLGGSTNIYYSGTRLVSLGAENQPFYKKKDAFTHVEKIWGLDLAKYEVRVRRTNYSTIDPNDNLRNYHTAILYTITGSSNQNPIIAPPGCTLARTAISILASDSINGRLEGINGLVQSVCFDYDYTIATVGDRWKQKRATSNPASLFLHVLTHPANLFRIGDNFYTGSVDLTSFTTWHNYCREQGFEYNAVLDTQRSVLEVLRDIASAGRASPMIIDGKWSIIIDKPRTSIVQHFTPYNSWGFESTKILPRRPHAFKVIFRNEEKAYKDDEIIVPNEGYTAETATFIEQITLPGVTSRAAAAKHARFHLAQLKLRPETYTINSDFEYLVCNRGDLVRVTHDVPQWGSGFGRIKSINILNNTTELTLDQPIYLLANNSNYRIRIRTNTGSSILAVISPVLTEQEYSTITVTTVLNTVNIGDMFMAGTINTESQELIVLSIEPTGNTSARLTLVDYSPNIYSVDTNTLNPSSPFNIPRYNANLTKLPDRLLETITKLPIVDSNRVRSDEGVLTRTSDGTIISNMQVPFKNPDDLSKTVSHVEINYDFRFTSSNDYQFKQRYLLSNIGNSLLLENLQDGVEYKYRLRYLTEAGISGPWSSTYYHTVIGKTAKPSTISQFTSSLNYDTGTITLNWSSVPELDLAYYEVRTGLDSGWGTNSNIVFKGLANSCTIVPNNTVGNNQYWIRAYDILGNYSASSATTSITIQNPGIPTIPNDFNTNLFAQSTLTDSIYTFTWQPANPVPANSLRVDKYKIVLIIPTEGLNGIEYKEITTTTNSLSWQTNVSWIGAATFKIQAIDILGNQSAFAETNITKSYPNIPNVPTITPIGTAIKIQWATVIKTSLPIAGYEIRTLDNSWGTGGSVWKGNVTTADIDLKGKSPGSYVWYLRAFDSDGKYSESSRTINYILLAPPVTTIDDPIFQDTSRTNASVTLNWLDQTPIFGLSGYIVQYTYTNKIDNQNVTNTIFANTNTITVPGNWVGSVNFLIYTKDLLGNTSSAAQKTVNIALPVSPLSFTGKAIDNTVLLNWSYPDPEDFATFPVETVRLKKGNTYQTSESIGDKSGTFTVITELAKGTYTYWCSCVDTEGNVSAPISAVVEVRQPPDYTFLKDWSSNFSGTKTNAAIVPNTYHLILPIDSTETWQNHFSSRGWSTPQDQIDAGYSVYIQPGNSTGSYQEIFDYGQSVEISLVTLSISGQSIVGTTVLTPTIEISLDQNTWINLGNVYTTYADNFRYVRVTLNATQITPGSIFYITNFNLRLDIKEISDSGSANITSTDIHGTTVNFNKEFIDVSSVILSPRTYLGYASVYTFLDNVQSGTYSRAISTGITTITINTLMNYTNTTVEGIEGNTKIKVTIPTGHELETGDLIKIITTNLTTYNTTSYKTITVLSPTIFTITQNVSSSNIDTTCQLYASILNRLFKVNDLWRVSFSQPSETPDVFSIQTVTDETVTIQLPAIAFPSSGTAYLYPNNMRVFLYQAADGTRASGEVSWTVNGY